MTPLQFTENDLGVWTVLEMTWGFGIGLPFFSLKLNLLSGRLKFIGLLVKKEGLIRFWLTKPSSYEVLGLHLDPKTFKGGWCLGFSLKCWGFVWDLFMLLFAFWSYLLSLYRLSSYCQLFSITLFRGFLWEFCWVWTSWSYSYFRCFSKKVRN